MAASLLTGGTLLGEGSFGKVYLRQDETGRQRAVKEIEIIPSTSADNNQILNPLLKEIELMKEFDHVRIVRYIGYERTQDTLYIFMEYMPGGSIRNELNNGTPFTEAITKKYTKQMLQGLSYLHDEGIIHRDVKGDNTLLDGEGNIKLADFGLAKQMITIQTLTGNSSGIGTLYWMSPQVLTGEKYGRRADIWSTGATVVEMLTTFPPWAQANLDSLDIMTKITELADADYEEYFLDPAISSEARAFLALTFKPEEADRPRAEELLANPWLQTE